MYVILISTYATVHNFSVFFLVPLSPDVVVHGAQWRHELERL